MTPNSPSSAADTPSVAAFVDGQNLFYAAKETFGYREANYDVLALAKRLCSDNSWQLRQVRFYTGLPGKAEDEHWHLYWSAKLRGMRNAGIEVITRPLRYRWRKYRLPYTFRDGQVARVLLPDGTPLPVGSRFFEECGDQLPEGTQLSVLIAEEKGIDVRLAVDALRMAARREYDIGLIFSQDQDLAEVADEIKKIGREGGHPIRLLSAFPADGVRGNQRGINHTDWMPIHKAVYEQCLDTRDYHPRKRK